MINGSQQSFVTQILKNVQMPLHSNTIVSSVNGTFPLPSVSHPQLQVQGGAAAALACNAQQLTASAQTKTLPLVSDKCYSLGRK